MNQLIVRKSPGRGRGVFAGRDFKAGAVIEVCPVLIVDQETGESPGLFPYSFCWDGEWDPNVGSTKSQHGDPNCDKWTGNYAIALGYGSIYNHSYEPSAHFENHYDDAAVVFIANRAIRESEEITVNYNGPGWPDQNATLGFEVK